MVALCRYVDDSSARKEAEAIRKKAQASAQAALTGKLAKAADGTSSPAALGSTDASSAAEQPASEPQPESEDAADNPALEAIMTLISAREGAKGHGKAMSAADSFLDSLPGPPPKPGEARGIRSSSRADREAEKKAEADFERRRQRERLDAENKLRAAEASYTDALRSWERVERWVLSKWQSASHFPVSVQAQASVSQA